MAPFHGEYSYIPETAKGRENRLQQRSYVTKWPIGCAVENFEPLKNGLEIRAEPLHLGFFRKSLEDGRIHTIHRLIFFHVSFTIGIGLGVIRLKKGSVDVPMH